MAADYSKAGVDWQFIRECVEEARSDYVGYHESNKPGEPDTSKYDAALEALSTPTMSDLQRQEYDGEALADHFPTGLRSGYARTAGGIPVQGGGIEIDCRCGWSTNATDEHEARQQWAGHVRAALAHPAQATPSALSGDKGGSDFLGMFDGPMGVVNRPTQKYRKTALITATQWFKDGDHPAVRMYDDIDGTGNLVGWIDTLEGGYVVTPGDWIATGIHGEHWAIKPDIFAATYEPVASALSGDAGEE